MSQFEKFKQLALTSHQPTGRAEEALMLADFFEENGDRALAATALDYAYGLDPNYQGLANRRQAVLESMAVTEHGIKFQYIPAGTFLMGANDGDKDEAPIHAVQLDDYWISETPITWATFTDLMGWAPPPASHPRLKEGEEPRRNFGLMIGNQIRMQYCESETIQARDWHAHSPNDVWSSGQTSAEMFGPVPRENADRPWEYDAKPAICLAHQDAQEMAARISNSQIQFRLPFECEWEKAARGGLINQKYPWGSNAPNHQTCDFDHFGNFYIAHPRKFPPNSYGLRAMSGGVWEWTLTPYDSLAYQSIVKSETANGIYRVQNHHEVTEMPAGDDERQFVIRGGSWADCAAACTVSFRQSNASLGWDTEPDYDNRYWDSDSPNIGFRLCRVELRADA